MLLQVIIVTYYLLVIDKWKKGYKATEQKLQIVILSIVNLNVHRQYYMYCQYYMYIQ